MKRRLDGKERETDRRKVDEKNVFDWMMERRYKNRDKDKDKKSKSEKEKGAETTGDSKGENHEKSNRLVALRQTFF